MAKDIINASDISDILIERPIGFTFKNRRIAIYHPSLGKMQLMSRLLETIGYSRLKANDDVFCFSYVAVIEHREECLRLIAYATLQGSDCLDEGKVQKRLKVLGELETDDIATLLLTALTMDKADLVMKHFGIDKESQKASKVSALKLEDSGNSIMIGGRSVWGSLIDAACERYGWSLQYVLWGLSLANLRLMLADKVVSVFLTDEERKKLHIHNDRVVIKADDVKALNDFIDKQSWR